MLKHNVKFKDYNDRDRTVELYFNLSESELIEWELNTPGGLQKRLEEATQAEDIREIYEFIRELILKSYGIKSEDGVHFRKSDSIRDDLVNSSYWDALIFGLLEDGGRDGIAFITGVMPAKLVQTASEKANATKAAPQDGGFQSPPNIQSYASTEDAKPTETAVPTTASNPEYDEFLAWKNSQGTEAGPRPEESLPRPPHESGPGYFQQ